MRVRQRRLKADYDRLSTVFSGKTPIRIVDAVGNPPEKYQIEYLVTSLQQQPGTGKLVTHHQFIAEIVLTSAYPRMAPQCRMLTPIYHPNIAPHAICIGDHWAAGESLLNLLLRIGEIIAYQSYNTKSPLNGDAARWVDQNLDSIPFDSFDFSSLLSISEAGGRRHDDANALTGKVCANCGSAETLAICANDHIACSDCLVNCSACGKQLCLRCSMDKCVICKEIVCSGCMVRCGICGRIACKKHANRCSQSREIACEDCYVLCAACGKPVTLENAIQIKTNGSRTFHCASCLES